MMPALIRYNILNSGDNVLHKDYAKKLLFYVFFQKIETHKLELTPYSFFWCHPNPKWDFLKGGILLCFNPFHIFAIVLYWLIYFHFWPNDSLLLISLTKSIQIFFILNNLQSSSISLSTSSYSNTTSLPQHVDSPKVLNRSL